MVPNPGMCTQNCLVAFPEAQGHAHVGNYNKCFCIWLHSHKTTFWRQLLKYLFLVYLKQCVYAFFPLAPYFFRNIISPRMRSLLLQAPLTDITDSNKIVEHLPLVSTHTDKLIYPALDSWYLVQQIFGAGMLSKCPLWHSIDLLFLQIWLAKLYHGRFSIALIWCWFFR